jgi:hypothetical protein
MSPDNRYAALILKEVSGDPLHKGLLRSPLTLACLISEYFRLIFPMRGSVSPIIDSVFDEALRYPTEDRNQSTRSEEFAIAFVGGLVKCLKMTFCFSVALKSLRSSRGERLK